jgi:hypothetical protein
MPRPSHPPRFNYYIHKRIWHYFVSNNVICETVEVYSCWGDSGLENREYGRRDPLCWPRNTLYSQELALTSTTSGGCSVGIVRSRVKATEFVCYLNDSSAIGRSKWGYVDHRCE